MADEEWVPIWKVLRGRVAVAAVVLISVEWLIGGPWRRGRRFLARLATRVGYLP